MTVRRLRPTAAGARPATFALVALAAALAVLFAGATGTATSAGTPAVAAGWSFFKYPEGQPLCTAARAFRGLYFGRSDCGHGDVSVSGTTATSQVVAELFEAGATAPFATVPATFVSGTTWRFGIRPAAAWPAGEVVARVRLGGEPVTGQFSFFHNELGASITPDSRPGGYRPGDELPVSGTLHKLSSLLADTQKTPVRGTYSLRVVTATGEVRGPFGPYTADKGGDGAIRETLPGSATAGLTATADTNFETTLALEVVDASYTNGSTGAWRTKRSTAGVATIGVAPENLVVESSFVSSRGWVKPGESYPFRVLVRNYSATARSGAVVTVAAPDGTTFMGATPVDGAGTASVSGSAITWTVGEVAGRTAGGPTTKTLVVQAQADSLAQDQQIVWKDLSTTASLGYTDGPAGLSDTSHGPKVIPPRGGYETARFGDRPFPVVPVDFRDRKHEAAHSGERLAAVINSPEVAGSTFNLFQEMSYGQLFPHGTVPSAGVASAGWNVPWKSDRYRSGGFKFTRPLVDGPAGSSGGACLGATTGAAPDTPLTPERIKGGWYQLPGDTNYYGGDPSNVAAMLAYQGTRQAALATAVTLRIDSACGPIAKAVFDAAHIADPEIDYSDYDTDKDGVVDFFMMVFVGAGGNGVSQLSVPPYDNIWPHSFDLRAQFKDPDTGQEGYISDDQLRDNAGRPLYYTNAKRTQMTTSPTDVPVYVRVGPYNVNPESAIERASVISHEYGHSLGLPDFYSVGARSTYGDWNLMATDKSQHMDVFSKQELGWIVPRPLPVGESTATGWRDSKANTNRIDWQQPDGTPYTLSGPDVRNGEAYTAKLPGRILIDSKHFESGAEPVEAPFVKGSGDHAWWSHQGDDFGCAPQAGHNLDIHLPELATLPKGTPVTLTFKSKWDIEWDWDYGFVMISPNGGETYKALPSQKGYTTPSDFNPNAVTCLLTHGNGITGTSGSYGAGTQQVDRLPEVGGYPDGGFLGDQYDLTELAGAAQDNPDAVPVLRFSYFTDAATVRPGWFVDDVKVVAGGQVIYDSTMEESDEPDLFNGGCKDGLAVAATCTDGWRHISGSLGNPADHAYYLEMRDRSGFDLEGRGQNDRAPIGFTPGLLLTYTDENHGYGNSGTPDPPAQSPLDAHPEPGNNNPNLNDAAFTAGTSFGDGGAGWVDNYVDPGADDDRWRFSFDCLAFQVLGMSGDDVGPAESPGNLAGDVRFTVGPGCAAFDYGHGGPLGNYAPTAVIQTKSLVNKPSRPVRFDASRSTDDQQTAAELAYAWDFTGDGTTDATGQTARYSWKDEGSYPVTLTVTDAGGLTDTDTVTIEVRR
jgi:M6 family metalloprotease-like protein